MVEQFTLGMDFEAFRSNPMAVAAVERKLQIISEAAIRLGSEAERRCPDQPAINFAMPMNELIWRPCGRQLRMICRR
jgi:uncharacterized protein with HEPN domain